MKPLTISLVGMGVAGHARLKALQENPNWKLLGIVSRRPEFSTLSLQDALQNPSLDAIAISTENTSHAQLAEQGLLAKKHVLCDYPLALEGSTADHLRKLALKKNKILHVEHIGLLNPIHREIKDLLTQHTDLVSGNFYFQGDWNEKLQDIQKQGAFPFLTESRWMQLYDWFFPFKVQSIYWQSDTEQALLNATLELSNGAPLHFCEKRSPKLPRKRHLVLNFKNEIKTFDFENSGKGLFAQDLEHFRQRILKKVPCYYRKEWNKEVLEFLEKTTKKGAHQTELLKNRQTLSCSF